ncbi:MAG TPA: hypothetical protein VN681_13000 [Stellaceae bacterium]|nr:hypothetical protein [Stellaceae bacterium]
MYDQVLTVIAAILAPLGRARRSAWRSVVAKLSARRIGAAVDVLDSLCARMNEGLAAFALVLGLVLAVTITVQHAEAVLLPDAESGLATGDVLLTP